MCVSGGVGSIILSNRNRIESYFPSAVSSAAYVVLRMPLPTTVCVCVYAAECGLLGPDAVGVIHWYTDALRLQHHQHSDDVIA